MKLQKLYFYAIAEIDIDKVGTLLTEEVFEFHTQ